jgi:predicted RNase H-like HicB family nuclease
LARRPILPSDARREHPMTYLAYFPALEGYNTCGKTYEEAIKHAEETLTLYLESFDELGKSILEERGLKQPTLLI